jgi:hypothetical protein
VSTPKKHSIAFVIDDRVSREKIAILTRAVNTLRQTFMVELIKGNETTEELLLQRIQSESFDLVLAPLHRYQTWNRIEAFFGANRTGGATFAGYFCEPLTTDQLPDPSGQARRIVLDFVNLTPSELLILIRGLIGEQTRSGLKPLVEVNTSIHCESWYGSQGQGSRTDHVLALPEISGTPWTKRSASIRILLSSLWGLVYEEGSGKVEVPQSRGTKTPKAYFQVAADTQSLFLRLIFQNASHFTSKEALRQFWPDKASPTKAAQLLGKYSDMIRVITIPESAQVEVVVGLFNSAPSEKAPEQAHTIWIEPLAAKHMTELPFEAPSPQSPHLKALPTVSVTDAKPRKVEDLDASKSRVILDATAKIKELTNKVDEQTGVIQELRSGGIGTAPPLPPPDAEALLEAFQQRYFDAKLQIRQFEVQIVEYHKRGATPQEIETLRQKMDAVANRQKAWIKKLMETLESFREVMKKPKDGS